MRAASHEWGNGTGPPLPHRYQPMPPYHTAVRAPAGAEQLSTAAVNGLNFDATGTLSPRHSRPRLGRARGWQETSGVRVLADSSRRPKLKKLRTSRLQQLSAPARAYATYTRNSQHSSLRVSVGQIHSRQTALQEHFDARTLAAEMTLIRDKNQALSQVQRQRMLQLETAAVPSAPQHAVFSSSRVS